MPRCLCDRPQLADQAPSTYRGPLHFTRCPHSTLRHDTRRGTSRLPRAKPVLGTRRVIAIYDEEDEAA